MNNFRLRIWDSARFNHFVKVWRKTHNNNAQIALFVKSTFLYHIAYFLGVIVIVGDVSALTLGVTCTGLFVEIVIELAVLSFGVLIVAFTTEPQELTPNKTARAAMIAAIAAEIDFQCSKSHFKTNLIFSII